MTAEQAIIGAIFAGLALLLRHFGKIAIRAYRVWHESRMQMRAQIAKERETAETREDTAQHRIVTAALSMNEAVVKQWFAETRETIASLKERCTNLEATAIRLTDENKELRKTLRRVQRERDEIERKFEHLRDEVLRDFARKQPSIPAGPPHEPILRAVQRGDDD